MSDTGNSEQAGPATDRPIDPPIDPGDTAICTWFVGDEAGEATFSPQINTRTDTPEAQAIYWRCTLCFFASSITANPGRRHMFFTNVAIATVDRVDVAKVLRGWGVEIVALPITYRLPKGAVQSWGSQFYTFDVLDYLARAGIARRYMILDSDCVWMRPVDEIEAAIERDGVLSYEIGHDEHAEDEAINGVSRAALARFLAAEGFGAPRAALPYLGGEFFAATDVDVRRLSEGVRRVWPKILALVPDAPREDGHMLSVLFAMGGYPVGNANRFVRRMWTTFHHHNLRPEDEALTIWHMPAEKKTGFAELFARIARWGDAVPAPDRLGFGPVLYRRAMGYPRRRPAKLVRDLAMKLREKMRR